MKSSNLPTFGVMSLGPVIACARLSKDKVVGSEDLAVGAGADRVHGARLQVQQDRTRDVLATYDKERK